MQASHTKVLLIEDNPGDARIIKELLSEARTAFFEIEVAERLSDGLEALSARRFDVVLLDLSLPDSSGLETLTKALPMAQHESIIVLTGLDDEDVAMEAVRKGAQDFLVKGQIDENLLPRAIRYAMQRKGAQEALQKAHDELEYRVEERTAQLAKTTEQLRLELTERKHAEEALRESEEKYRDLVDLLPQTIFEIDEKGNLTFTNRCGFESFGYSQEDLDKGLNALQLFIPEDRERVSENMRKVLTSQEPGTNEYTALRKDGILFPVITCSSGIIRDGQPVGLRGIVIDITERKRAEQERVQRERLHGVVEMAGAVCHELNQPMQVVSAYSQLMMAELSEENTLRDGIKKIKAQIDRMGRITRKLMRITRYETRDYLFEGEKIIDIDKASGEGK